jgi:hypothetical protein
MACFMDNLQVEMTIAPHATAAAAAVELRQVDDAPGIAAMQVEMPGGKVRAAKAEAAIDPCLVGYETAFRALTVAKSAAEIRDILLIADAMDAYARKTNDRSIELVAIELRFYAEGRLNQVNTPD